MKKIHLISLTTYCSKSKTFSIEDILIEKVQKEDEINHPWKPIEIPKLKEIKSYKMNPTPLKALATEILNLLNP